MGFMERLKMTGAHVLRASMVLVVVATAQAQTDDITTPATLLDRIQIEDMLTNYYWDLTSAGRNSIAAHYTQDATFDVNGIMFKGRDEIQLMYGGDSSMGARKGGRFNMLMNNPRIRINGNTATADIIFTGIISDTVNAAPRLFEQGLDHLELVKQEGHWLITKRVLTSHGGLPKDFAEHLRHLKQKRVN
jgi:hypothetical protein